MATPEQRAYAKALNDIAKRFDNLDDTTLRRLVELLQNLRRGIADQILAAEGFEAFRLNEMQQNIGLLIDSFQSQASAATGQAFQQITKLGAASVVEPLQAAGIQGAFFAPNQAIVNVALDFSAELIKDITAPMRAQINTQLRLGVLGQDSPFKVMKNITNILGVKASDGVWGLRNRPEVVKGVAARAETIVRTENTRMFNLAANSQQQATAQQVPGLIKIWMATGDKRTRDSHLIAHGQERPISQPFDVGASQLMFPGDPAASAEETINCRCGMRTSHPDIGELPPNPLDKKIAAEIEKRNNGSP